MAADTPLTEISPLELKGIIFDNEEIAKQYSQRANIARNELIRRANVDALKATADVDSADS